MLWRPGQKILTELKTDFLIDNHYDTMNKSEMSALPAECILKLLIQAAHHASLDYSI